MRQAHYAKSGKMSVPEIVYWYTVHFGSHKEIEKDQNSPVGDGSQGTSIRAMDEAQRNTSNSCRSFSASDQTPYSARSSILKSPLPMPAAAQPPYLRLLFHATCVMPVSSS